MDITQLIASGASNLWIFIPTAIFLGALHGLEPGHSKTMIAAFIIAIRGTTLQAILLGIAATVSHTAIVWAIALIGMYFGKNYNSEASEPYFQLFSGVLIIMVALWMLYRISKHQKEFKSQLSHNHDAHDHDHHHHEHDHIHEYQDAHELSHADDINRRFADKNVTNGQIVLFGLTGGLIPCPASITVLLLCLQLKKIVLGSLLVLCFSIGLAATMVITGVVAALSVNHLSKRWSGFNSFARNAPYFSGVLISLIGLYVFYSGLKGII